MVLPDHVRLDDARRRHGETGLGIARSEGAATLHFVDQFGARRRRLDRPVEAKGGAVIRRRQALPEARREEAAKLRQPRCCHRQARGHGVAPAVDQQVRLAGRNHRRPQVDARHRASRSLALAAVRVHGDDQGREVVAVLQPAGDDPDHARVPAFAGGEYQIDGPGPRGIDPGLHLGGRLLQHLRLDGPALHVEGIQAPGVFRRLRRIVGGEQPGPQARLADPAPRRSPGAPE